MVITLTSPHSYSRAAAVTGASSDVLAESVGSATSVLVPAKQLLEAHHHHRQMSGERSPSLDSPRIRRYKLVIMILN